MENSKLITILAQVDEGTKTPFKAHNEILSLSGVGKRTSLTWKIIALFGVGYMLVDLIRYVC
jgi:hypothetical protein